MITCSKCRSKVGVTGPCKVCARKATLVIDFGALCYPIAKQFLDQGVRMNVGIRSSTAIWQKDADAITRLAVRQLLPDSAARNARKKLLKKIIRGIEANAQDTNTSVSDGTT